MKDLVIIPATATAGQAITISGTVVNTGGLSADYTVILKVDRKPADTSVKSVDPGSSLPVKFSITGNPGATIPFADTAFASQGKGLTIGYIAGFIGLLTHAVGANTFIIVRIMEPFWFLTAMVVVIPQIEATDKAQRGSQSGPAST